MMDYDPAFLAGVDQDIAAMNEGISLVVKEIKYKLRLGVPQELVLAALSNHLQGQFPDDSRTLSIYAAGAMIRLATDKDFERELGR